MGPGCHDSTHYLGNFFFLGPDGSGQCELMLRYFIELSADLGVPLVHEKMEGLLQVLMFLGVELESVAQTSQLPFQKLETLCELLIEFKRKASLREFQQFNGHLNFACNVVAQSRAFVRHLCDTTMGL